MLELLVVQDEAQEPSLTIRTSNDKSLFDIQIGVERMILTAVEINRLYISLLLLRDMNKLPDIELV